MFQNIDTLPLGNILQIKQDKGNVSKVRKKGPPKKKKQKK